MDIDKSRRTAGGRRNEPFPLGSALFIVSVFFMTFVGRVIISPLLLPIEDELGLNHAQGGALFFVISLGLILTMFFSGFVLRRMQHHTCIALSGMITGVALFLLAASRDLFWFRIGLFLTGAAAGLYLPSGIVTITELVPLERRGVGIAMHELGPILGLAASPLIAELALRLADWRSLLWVLGAVSLLLGILFARFGRGGRLYGTPPHWRALYGIVKQRDFWIIAIFFILAIGHEVGIYSMLPAYLIDGRGINQSFVNSIVSTSRLTSLLMVFTAGWLADSFGYKRMMAVTALLCGSVTVLLGVAQGWLLIAALYIQPMLISAFFPAGITAMAGICTAEQRNLSVSLIVPLGYLFGGGTVPALIGRLAEQGSFGLGFIIVGSLFVISVLLVPLLSGRRDGPTG